jgi:hypothetical protein
MSTKQATPVQASRWTSSVATGLLHAALIWPLSGPALTGGTAAAYSFEVLQQADEIGRLVVPCQSRRSNMTALRSVKEDVELIRVTFGLKMSEVAQLFNVSRPAAYAWLDGALPKSDAMSRLSHVARQAEQVKAANIDRIGRFIRRPLQDGRSMLQLLKEGADIQNALATIKQAAAEDETGRKLSASRYSSAKKGDVASIDEVSVPIIKES